MIDKETIAQARQLLVDQNKEKVIEIANRVIADGHDPLELMNEAFIPGINEVGDLFGRGRLFLPELMVAADAMKAVTDVINAALPKKHSPGKKGNGAAGHGKRGCARYRQMHCGVPDAGQRVYRP